MRVRQLVALVIMFVVMIASPSFATDTLRVGAAANLQKVLAEALIPAFEKKALVEIVPTFGSTKQLAAQLQNGAPLDVFVAADTATVDKLTKQGVLISGTARVYAIGRLVLWTRQDAMHHPKRLEDLADPAYAKIAIANPALAPYGLAAQQAFEKAGLTASVAPRLAEAENIAQALQFAKSGNADVALTALSLVIDDKTDPYVIVSDKLHTPITQSAAIVAASQNKYAPQFLAFLTSHETAAIWKRYGYELPKK